MNTATLEAFISEKMSATRLPGLSIALVKGDEVVYSRGFGLADIERRRPATPQTLYGAASITKSFAAISILQLAEKGLLKLRDPVERFLPCPINSKDGPIRIEHLLTHTSGMTALGYIEAVLRHAHDIGGCELSIGSAGDVLAFAQGDDARAETSPGERWFYLNEGYVLLGAIIERISGLHYEEYIREHIVKPLGMSRSFFTEQQLVGESDLAIPYVLPRDGSPCRAGRYVHGVLSADAALITSALDLARYLSMFLRKGRGVLSEHSFEQMTTPRIAMPGQSTAGWWGKPATAPAHYGYGLIINDDFFGEPLIGHGGSLLVMTSYIGFLPRSNLGVAVLTNGNGYGMSQLGKVALAVLLGRDPSELAFVRSERLLNDLSGMYETYRGTVRAMLVREGDVLRMEYLCGDQPPTPLTLIPERLGENEPRFFTYSEGQRFPIEFHCTSSGIDFIYERYKFKRTGPLI